MNSKVTIRKFRPLDKEQVLKLLELNTPQYFAPDEEIDLMYYLAYDLEYYFVLELDYKIIGCGGFDFFLDSKVGRLSWDIIHPDYQRRKLGTMLLNYRVERLKEFKEVQQITICTSQLAYRFYEKSGFKVLEVAEDKLAKGFQLYKMEYANR